MNEIIVIGGGHAGIEAANAAAKMGIQTTLITSNINTIGMTPCNPSIGGPAKGNVVVEIDALGGLMGEISDESMLQIKKLNRSKGPAVQAIRAQIDKEKYQKIAQKKLFNIPNLNIVEDFIEDLIIENKIIKGVIGKKNTYHASQVILTTGTYMDSYIIAGEKKEHSGPNGLPTSKSLSNSLTKNGFKLFRLKTGTPARIERNSIDFSQAEIAPGDSEHIKFSHYKQVENFDYEKQVDCHLIYTQPQTHKIILENMHKSGMSSGLIDGVGARYCPSIEDKLQRFSDKDRHQLFLEPEGLNSNSIYVQGFSTSMPEEVQIKMIKSLPGLENAQILKYGYAIEYDAIYPEQLKTTLETKVIKGLFTAGQINGTSGYEEAAGQGIIAGINAACNVKGIEPFVLSRAESYIGVMIDDLITKGSKEPYRLLTSRSEYRLFLRNDNADRRLTEYAYKLGLIDAERYQIYTNKKNNIEKILEYSHQKMLSPKIITNELAKELQTEPLKHGLKLSEFLKRPNIKLRQLVNLIPELNELKGYQEELEIAETEIKYEGYINKIKSEIVNFNKNEKKIIPDDIDYNDVEHLALEAREKLIKIKPQTIGQASRISGINPSDITVLLFYLKNKYN